MTGHHHGQPSGDGHGPHEHAAHHTNEHQTDGHHNDHKHEHPSGLRGLAHRLFVPHSHDAADSIDDALQANADGVRALKTSLLLLLGTTALQAVIVAFSGSVALLADTIHNFSDALTAVPLWIAFALSRRAATRRYTYGYHRAEDLAGLFIVAMIALSVVTAAWQAVGRLLNPRPMEHVGWVIAAGVIGFVGNEAVAVYRIRVGRRIGSAALVADGVHARADGFTSLAVVLGGIGSALGYWLTDPIVGLAISAAIFVLLVGTVRSVGRRLMDGVEPELVERVEHALEHVNAVRGIERVRLRWLGHRLAGDVVICLSDVSLAQANAIAAEAERQIKQHLPNADDITVRTLVA